ncbi:MAG: hypothetical protein HY209_03900 [Candidatus Omnitrophica bacterium]|nr:hypothetical protein [Candidatus Omnitrophota bacterium]
MMRIVLFIILCLGFGVRVSDAAIEIYAAGQHFDSFEDYQKSRQNNLEPLHAPLIPGQVRQKLEKVSYNDGIDHVVVDFQQDWQNPKPRFILDADELEQAIRETMGDQQQPMLLISDPQKMRMMSYSPQDKLPSDQNTQDGQKP